MTIGTASLIGADIQQQVWVTAFLRALREREPAKAKDTADEAVALLLSSRAQIINADSASAPVVSEEEETSDPAPSPFAGTVITGIQTIEDIDRICGPPIPDEYGLLSVLPDLGRWSQKSRVERSKTHKSSSRKRKVNA